MKTNSFISLNSFSTSGRIVKDAETFDTKHGKCYRFSIAHNMGKDRDALFTDIVMFDKNGKQDVAVDESLLKKGTAVVVEGYRRPNNLRKDGKIVKYGTDYVALTLTSIESYKAELDGSVETENEE